MVQLEFVPLKNQSHILEVFLFGCIAFLLAYAFVVLDYTSHALPILQLKLDRWFLRKVLAIRFSSAH